MNCPRCKAKMMPEGLTQVIGEETYQTWVCPSCGFIRTQAVDADLPN